MYAHDLGSPKYIKQLLTDLMRKPDKNNSVVGNLNIYFTAMNRSSRHKINKEISALTDTLDHIDLISINRKVYPKMTK